MEYKCYVLHVKKGYEDREKSIIDQFSRIGIPFEWVLDHDREEITPDLLAKYQYKGDMTLAEISCSLKHIRAWELIAQGNAPGGIVFEDDCLIDIDKFQTICRNFLREYHANCPGCGYVSLGSGSTLYVPWTKKQKNKLLYLAEYTRTADAYWINLETAVKMVQWIKGNGIDRPADHLIDRITIDLNIPIFWLAPTLVDQGSHTGVFRSSIQRMGQGKVIDRLMWLIKLVRRKYLYPLLGIDLRKK